MDARLLTTLVNVTNERKELDAKLKTLKAEEKRLGALALEELIEAGAKSIHVAGCNVHLHTQSWAKILGDRERAKDALRHAGMEEAIRVNSSVIGSMIREFDAEHGDGKFFEQYPELAEHIGWEPTTSVRVTKG